MTDINSYITSFDEKVQAVLMKLKQTIEKAAPEAVAGIAYGMPSYKLNGKPLAYFAANKKHAGFYPTAAPIAAFKEALANYKCSKGAVQFPYDQKLPVSLITKMVRFRAKQIMVTGK